MSDAAVTLEIDDNVGIMRFNRPERLNAWSRDVGEAFIARLNEAKANDSIKGVVLTGNGRAYSAGADLKNPSTHSVESVEDHLASHSGMPVFDTLSTFPKPIISAVNGYAIGIGCLVPLCCDFIIASEKAVFGLPQVSLGILPAYGGTLRLARHVGRGNALDMALTGRHVGGEEALRMGLVSRLVPHDDLVAEAIATMRKLTAMPVHAVRLAKESLRIGYDSGMTATEQGDAMRFLALAQTQARADRHEAWRAGR
ncbi:MAG: enoyl-CoA hydratase/isomerase family protein [Dehalococcoidia bacterium]